MFQVKRIYEEPEASDGSRILVDALWPRGMSKEKARLDEWLPAIALEGAAGANDAATIDCVSPSCMQKALD